MIGITLTTDQIRNAPPDVRRWIEHEVLSALELGTTIRAAVPPPQAAHLVACSAPEASAVLAAIQGVLPAVNVFFEFGRPGVVIGHPPVMLFRLIDILHHTRMPNVEQVIACLEMINRAFAEIRGDASARFCGFDNEGHCLIAPETQRSIAALWQNVIAKSQGGKASA